jgi:arylsulfatase A-like enzyme
MMEGGHAYKTCLTATSLACLFGAAFGGGKTQRQPSPDPIEPQLTRPNIVFILTDDQGYGDLGRHGNPALKTPHIDRLSDESARFRNFVVSPSCSPTRCALMTGRHEFRSGVTHTIEGRCEMSLSATTLPQVLKSAGYTTGIFGKWHLGASGDYRPEKRGFDYSITTVNDNQDSNFDPVLLYNGIERKQQGYREDILFAEAIQFIQDNRDEPFFCYIPTYAPHSPNKAPDEYVNRNGGNAFFGQISNIDDNIGRLMDFLKVNGLDSNTMVIFMNDNGGTWGVDLYNAGMRGCKGSAWYGGTRAMSFWRWPGRIASRILDAAAGAVDLLPTLAELAGASLPENLADSLDGVSLLPLLFGDVNQLSDRMLFTHVGRWRDGEEDTHKYALCSVHWNDYLLVRNHTCGNPGCMGECRVFQKVINGSNITGYSKRADYHYAVNQQPAWALFNTLGDPGQEHDLVDQYPGVVEKMAAVYEKWWAGVYPYTHRLAVRESNPFREWYKTP